MPCPLKTYLKNIVKFDVSRVMGFCEFPNTSPSGKRVDSVDPIPRTFRKFSKKRHPRNVGVDTRHPNTLQWSNRGRFRGTTPLAPINRRLPLLNFFTALLLLSRIVTLPLRGISSCAPEFATFHLSLNFSKVLFLSLFSSYLFFLLH
jgi:hypothetical protein